LTRAPKERIQAVWNVVAGILAVYDHDAAAAGMDSPQSKGRASQGRQIES
jgi:hypothetical protein